MDKTFFKGVFFLLAVCLFMSCKRISDSNLYMLIGTYTSQGSEGIYVYEFNQITGESKYVSKVKVENPSYLSISPDKKYVYAVSENDSSTAALNCFKFNKADGTLSFINKQSTLGGAPCYVSVDPQQKFAITANYSGGSISVFEFAKNGSLLPCSQQIVYTGHGQNSERQSQAHLHTVRITPDGKYLLASDLGTDHLYQYPLSYSSAGKFLDETGFQSYNLPPESGPRHIDFSPINKQVYLITELSGEVFSFNWEDAKLRLEHKIVVDTLNAQGSADIRVSPNGKYVYASNRLQGDGIAILETNDSGELTKIGYQSTGKHPRNFTITPNGKFLLCANRDSNNIQIFTIEENGLLNDTKNTIELSMPVCVQLLIKD